MRDHIVLCLFVVFAIAAAVFFPADYAFSETNRPVTAAAPTPEEASPGFTFKGISLGTPAADVRSKLGEPKDRSDAQDLYVFSDEESAQFLYDAQHKVTAIMLTYTGKLTGAPTPKEVFGEDVPPKPDGGISRMTRYPKAGYWIAYNKIVGDDSMISIAIQKIR